MGVFKISFFELSISPYGNSKNKIIKLLPSHCTTSRQENHDFPIKAEKPCAHQTKPDAKCIPQPRRLNIAIRIFANGFGSIVANLKKQQKASKRKFVDRFHPSPTIYRPLFSHHPINSLSGSEGVASPWRPVFHVTIKSFFARVIAT